VVTFRDGLIIDDTPAAALFPGAAGQAGALIPAAEGVG
jgi:hypothetical protein